MSFKGIFSLTRRFFLTSSNVKCMSYKSPLALDNLYPNSKEITPFKPPENPDGKFTGYIPINELEITNVAASGPGGQHVNKTASKVDVRFHIESASWLCESTKKKLTEKYSYRINKKGYFIVRSEKTKSQILNQAEAVNYIRKLVFELEKPAPVVSEETLEKHRKNAEKAARRRLMEKRSRAFLKLCRGPASAAL